MRIGFTHTIVIGLLLTGLFQTGEGTITVCTGLGRAKMWLQKSHPQAEGDLMTYAEAKDWAEDLTFAEYANWRLPSGDYFSQSEPAVGISIQNEFSYLFAEILDIPPGGNESKLLPFADYPNTGYWTSTLEVDPATGEPTGKGNVLFLGGEYPTLFQMHDLDEHFRYTAVRDTNLVCIGKGGSTIIVPYLVLSLIGFIIAAVVIARVYAIRLKRRQPPFPT